MITYDLKINSIYELELISKYTLFSSVKIRYKNIQNNTTYVTNAIPTEKNNGIYILFKKGKIVKIGQSKDIYRRLNSHDGFNYHSGNLQPEDWDTFSMIPCENDIDKFIIEGILIHMYKPQFNMNMKSKI